VLTLAVVLTTLLGATGCGLVGTANSGSSSGGNPNPAGEPAPSSQLSPSSSSVSFGNVTVGSPSVQHVILTDLGTANVDISSVSVTGSGFSATGGSNVTLTPNQTVTVSVNFNPATPGGAQGSLSITSNAEDPMLDIPLAGTGIAQTAASSQLTPSSASVSFGNVNVGTPSTQMLTLTDVGTANVSISSVSVTGGGFSASGGASVTLAPNGTATISVNFNPTSTGGVQGNLAISSNASNPVLNVPLSGTGAAAPAVQHSVQLNWQPSASAVIGYFVYRGPSANSLSKLINSVDQFTNYIDSSVADGQTYYYSVTSVNSSNVESAQTTPISVTIPSQ
jgi:Abnormal spindle-like microcephaly-assoc'd, ASPM-SPD-2-Hydin